MIFWAVILEYMNYLLSGDDTLSIRFRKQELIENFIKKNPEGKVFTFDFFDSQTPLEKLEEELSPSLFEIPKLVVVEGLRNFSESAPERIRDIFTTSKTTDTIFIETEKLTKTDPFIKLAKGNLENEEVYEAKKRDIQKFIKAREKDLGGTLDVKTLAAIQERSGKDDELMLQNIQKVLTYTQGKPLSSQDLDALVPAPLEAKVFDALDALVLGNKERALALFHRILSQEDIFRIFPLCAWQIRQMLLVTEAKKEAGDSHGKIAKTTGIHPFVVQKLLRVLPNFSRARLARGLRLLSELDVDLKLSKKTPEGALQHFIFHW